MKKMMMRRRRRRKSRRKRRRRRKTKVPHCFSDAIFDDPTDVYLDTQVFWHVTPYLSEEEVKRLR